MLFRGEAGLRPIVTRRPPSFPNHSAPLTFHMWFALGRLS